MEFTKENHYKRSVKVQKIKYQGRRNCGALFLVVVFFMFFVYMYKIYMIS